ncbi:MAG: hypothetical protein ISS93_01465 [Candidatus Aenigmarchaeota archaeon]|nr:hypothetical protein [Candidatus Aenigmarchaeota archaeon]
MKTPFLVVFIVFLLFLPLVQGLEINVTPENLAARSGEDVALSVIIYNNNNIADSFTISVMGDRIWWYQLGVFFIEVPPFESREIPLKFYPVTDVYSDYKFDVSVTSYTVPDLNASKPLTITVVPPLFLTSLETKRDGRELVVALGVDSFGESDVDIVFEVTGPMGDVASASFAGKISGKQKIEKIIQLPEIPKLLPGEYKVRAIMGGNVLLAAFQVEPIIVFETTVTVKSSPFSVEKVTEATSHSNVLSTLKLEEPFPSGDFVTGSILASGLQETENQKTYSYELHLQPGESKEYTTVVHRWPVLLNLVAVVIVVAVLGMLTARKYTGPRIRKKYKRGKKLTSVVVGVKNAYSDARNVIIRDWVSPLARVETGEFETVKPVIRRSDAGTELIWSLGTMKPREERLLGYKIKPLIQGNLRMSKTSMRYKNKKGETRRIHSKPLFIR